MSLVNPGLDEAALRRTYEANLNNFKSLEGEALFILANCIRQSGIKIHEIPSRIKSYDSFLDKAKRNQYDDPFKQINDVVGLRVICLFLSDIPKIGEIIHSNFEVLSEDNKIEGSDVSSFGYMSVHFTATIKPSHSGPRYDSIKGLPFEIQVRTLAMDAWANVSHYLDYKNAGDVPKELRKDFFALSGLFYVADTHFQVFYKARQESLRKTKERVNEADGLAQEINLDTLTAYLARRFPDREHGAPKDVSELLSEVKEASYTHLEEIDIQVSRALDAVLVWEKESPPIVTEKPEETKEGVKLTVPPAPTKYSDIGMLRMCLVLANPKYRPTSQKNLAEEIPTYRKMLH